MFLPCAEGTPKKEPPIRLPRLDPLHSGFCWNEGFAEEGGGQ